MAVFGIAFWLATLMGFVQKEAMYIGFAITLSSTMVVVKMLSDKRELDTLHSRLIVGILLVQDLFAIFALSLMTALNGTTITPLLVSFAKGAGIVIIALFCSKFIFSRMFKFAAESQELLMLLALAVLFTFSLAIAGIGMSITIGAFLAGVSLATLPYNIQIIGKIRSIRDFFATLFFVSLGMEIFIEEIRSLLLPLLV